MARKIPIYYWDSCAWIGFINREPKKIHSLQAIWADAEGGKCQIWTSSYSYLEVIKGALAYGAVHHAPDYDDKVDAIFAQPFVRVVQLDTEVAKLARGLRRSLHQARVELGFEDPLPRPDAIHLATAAFYNCDELHTWDKSHLIRYNGKVLRDDGMSLVIRIPGLDVYGPLFYDGVSQAKLDVARRAILQILALRIDELVLEDIAEEAERDEKEPA